MHEPTATKITDAVRKAGRPVVIGTALALIAVVIGLVVLLSPADWRTQLQVSVVPDSAVATLDRPGDASCAAVAAVPDAAGRAEFPVQARDTVRARAVVHQSGRVLRGPIERAPVDGGVVRLRLPDATTEAPAQICLESAQRAAFTVLGGGQSAGLRLVGAEPQSRLAQLADMLDRVRIGTAPPLSWLSGWVLLLIAGGTFAAALVVVVRGWSRAGSGPTRRTWAAIAVIGVLHAWTWAALMPAFQVPDETSHFHYAAMIADHGRLPKGDAPGPPMSESQQVVEAQLGTGVVAFRPLLRPPWTSSTDDDLAAALKGASLDVPDAHTNATGQPPLYYLSVAPAALGAPDALDQLARMRMLSGLWMAIAVLGAVALVRALAPARPRWALTAGLAVALFPLLGFVAGGVNPDVAMTALSFWTFAAAVRCWRDGLRPRNAALFGVVAVLLALTKLTGLAIVPGALLIVLAALIRDLRGGRSREALRAVAIGIGIAAIPALIYVLITVLSGRPIVPGVIGATATEATGGGAASAAAPGRTSDMLNTIWQLFLPRIPGRPDVFATDPLWAIWIDGLAGRFGYLDYGFSEPVRRLIAVGWVAVVVGAVAGFVRLARASGLRDVLRRFGPVLLGGFAAVALLLIVIGVMDYNSRSTNGPPFQQARYLLPGLPVAVMAVPLALRAFSRRWQPTVGITMIGLMVLWAVSAVGLTLVRYYG